MQIGASPCSKQRQGVNKFPQLQAHRQADNGSLVAPRPHGLFRGAALLVAAAVG